MHIEATHRYLAEELAAAFEGAGVRYKTGADPAALAVFIDLHLPGNPSRAREIAVQVAADAIKAFAGAGPERRGEMADRVVRITRLRLADGGYVPHEEGQPPFKVAIYAGDLEP